MTETVGPDLGKKRGPSPFVAAYQHLKAERDRLREKNITLQNKVHELESLLRAERQHRRHGLW